VDVQEYHTTWEWMKKTVTFNTVATVGSYTPVADLGEWDFNSFRAYLTAAGVGTEMMIPFTPYEPFYNNYLLGARKLVYSRPSEISVSPAKALLLGLAPNDIYTVSGEYYKAPVVLAADADTPEMPARFHKLIVYRAMTMYGAFEAANEVYQRGEQEYRRMINKLELNQLAAFTRAGSMI